MDIGPIAKALWAARSSGVIVPRVNVTFLSGSPAINRCHANVARWVQQNPVDKAVTGWLVFDLELAGWLTGQEPHFDFLAHSVVEKPDGTLADITPVYDPAARTYPFIRHPGTNDEFHELVDTYNCSRIKLLTHRNPMQAAYFES